MKNFKNLHTKQSTFNNNALTDNHYKASQKEKTKLSRNKTFKESNKMAEPFQFYNFSTPEKYQNLRKKPKKLYKKDYDNYI